MKKQKYLKNCYCNDHPQEKLNLVCIEPTCPKKGLICSLCKSDPEAEAYSHHGHESKIIPFKYLIQSLEVSFDHIKHFDTFNPEETYLNKLAQLKDESLFMLKHVVENMATFVERLEQKIIQQYEIACSSVMFRGDSLRKLKKVIQKATLHDIRKEDKYELIHEMKSLVIFIKENDEANQWQSKYELNLNPNSIIVDFNKEQQMFRLKCEKMQILLKKIDPDSQFGPDSNPQLIKNEQKERRHSKRQRRQDQQIQKDNFEKFNVQKVQVQEKQQSLVEKAASKIQKFIKKQKSIKHVKKVEESHLNLQKIPKELQKHALSFLPKAQYLDQEHQKMEPKHQNLYQYAEKNLKSAKMFQMMESFEKKSEQKDSVGSFSSLFKGSSIKLSKYNKIAKQTSVNESGIVLLQERLNNRSQIMLKIKKLTSKIIIGIALQKFVALNKCENLDHKGLNHGVFGIDNQGIHLFHGNLHVNGEKSNFNFYEHSILHLKFQDNNLEIRKIGGGKKLSKLDNQTLNIALKDTKLDLPSVAFCVYLGGKDDTVQLM